MRVRPGHKPLMPQNVMWQSESGHFHQLLPWGSQRPGLENQGSSLWSTSTGRGSIPRDHWTSGTCRPKAFLQCDPVGEEPVGEAPAERGECEQHPGR